MQPGPGREIVQCSPILAGRYYNQGIHFNPMIVAHMLLIHQICLLWRGTYAVNSSDMFTLAKKIHLQSYLQSHI